MKIDLTKKSKVAIVVMAALALMILCASLIACAAAQQRQVDAAIEPILVEDSEAGEGADAVAAIADDESGAEDADPAVPATGVEEGQSAPQAGSGNTGAIAPGADAPERAAAQTQQTPQTPQSQSQADHVHTWDPITEPYEVIDRHAWVENDLQDRRVHHLQRMRRGHHPWRQPGKKHHSAREGARPCRRGRRMPFVHKASAERHYHP